MTFARPYPARIAEPEREIEFEVRSCANKRRYKNEPPLPNMSMRAYPCKFCGGWHLATRKDDG